MSRKQAYLPLHQGFKFIDLEARLGRNAKRSVTQTLVIFHQNAHLPNLLVSVKVALIEDDDGGNVVGLGGYQKAVDETRRGAWMGNGRHHDGQIHVGGDDVRSLAQIH